MNPFLCSLGNNNSELYQDQSFDRLSFSMEEPLDLDLKRNSENHLELGFLLFNANHVNGNFATVRR